MSFKFEEESTTVVAGAAKAQGFRGVRMRRWGRWVSEIRIPKSRTRIWLGSYDAPEKAARAYDAAVYCLRGDSGKFNFPGERRPDLPDAQRRVLTMNDVKTIAANHAFLPPPIESSDHATGEFISSIGEDEYSLSNLSSDSFLLADAAVMEEIMSMWDLL
ncbi:ethylene-responsive transcription factor ERF015 [Typha latifolia]|uniref:ethylene-responsive transcription factor ERF015 n=1 Tax=Typha latifolia TaxID=4733 RepID=UPI003C2E6C3B